MNQLMKTGVHVAFKSTSVVISCIFYSGNADTWHINRWLGGDGTTWAGTCMWYYPSV